MTIIFKEEEAYQNINKIATLIKKGAIIIYPTETVYGLGCDAFNKNAYEKIIHLKKRENKKPMLLLIDSIQTALLLSSTNEELLKKINEEFWPGPLTTIVKANNNAPEWLITKDNKIAFRISSNKFVSFLMSELFTPIISTSANIANNAPCTTIEESYSQFYDNVDIYIDSGTLKGSPSTIIDISNLPAKIIRKGVISEQLIKQKLPFIF